MSLNFETYEERQERLKEESKKYENLSKVHEDLQVTSLEDHLRDAELDSIKMASTEKWVKNVTKDVYIYEALQVLNDMSIR